MAKNKLKGLPEIIDKNQGGLLDIELHPDYKIMVGYISHILLLMKTRVDLTLP